jgi:chromosome segregation ATPase
LKDDLSSAKIRIDELELKLGTLQINYDKMEEQLNTTREDHEDVVDKLHKMNKARHDLEIKLQDEIERNKSLAEVVSLRDETLEKRAQEIEELDKKVIDLERNCETIEIKKQGVERQFDLAKKQLNERINNLQEVITGEKETRDMWIERYEKEQKEHTATNAQLLTARSDLKDQVLAVKNTEIKLNTANRQIQILHEQNVKFQHQVNESVAKAENLDRELHTQKEILKQMEMTKKEYIDKLKKELDTIEIRY